MKKFTLLILLLTAFCVLPAGVSAQDTPGTVKCPASVDTLDSLFRIKDAAHANTTSLTAADATTIAVVSTADFPTSGSIKIGSEVIYYTSKTSTSFSGLTRGAGGTTAAIHASGSFITAPILAAHHNTLASAIICAQDKALAAVPNTRTVNGHALTANVTVSKSDVGLGNADNTSDANKPVSTATQTALNLKADTSSLATVATTGSASNLTGTLADARLSANVPLKDAVNLFEAAPTVGTSYANWFKPPFGSAIVNTTLEENLRADFWRASGSTKFMRGFYSQAKLTGTATLSGATGGGFGPNLLNRLVGAEISAWVDDDATVPWTIGVLATASNHNSGVNVPGSMAAVYAEVDMPRDAVNVYGIFIGAGNGTAAQHGYGLYIDNVASTADPHGVHVAGTWPNYFGGQVTVGGVLKAGTTPTTVTDAAGKVLSSALNTVAVAQGGTGVTSSTGSGSVVLNTSPTIPSITGPTVFTGQYNSTLNDQGNSSTAITINWNQSNVQYVTMTDNATFTFSNPVSGGRYVLVLMQDATGGRTATWPGSVLWPGGTVPTLTATAAKVDIITFVFDGINSRYYGGSVLNF